MEAMTTAFTAVQADLLTVVGVAGGLGLAVAGAMMLWKNGIGIFKSLVGKR